MWLISLNIFTVCWVRIKTTLINLILLRQNASAEETFSATESVVGLARYDMSKNVLVNLRIYHVFLLKHALAKNENLILYASITFHTLSNDQQLKFYFSCLFWLLPICSVPNVVPDLDNTCCVQIWNRTRREPSGIRL